MSLRRLFADARRHAAICSASRPIAHVSRAPNHICVPGDYSPQVRRRRAPRCGEAGSERHVTDCGPASDVLRRATACTSGMLPVSAPAGTQWSSRHLLLFSTAICTANVCCLYHVCLETEIAHEMISSSWQPSHELQLGANSSNDCFTVTSAHMPTCSVRAHTVMALAVT